MLEINSHIEAIENDASLLEEKNFEKRMEAIDFIEFHVIGWIEGEVLLKADQPAQLLQKHRAEKLKADLEKIDVGLFQQLRADIRTGRYTGKEFKNLVNQYVDFNLEDNERQEEPGYDNLDLFINGLFPPLSIPEQTKDLEPEMVFYQKTPARIVFELVEKCHFKKEDVFFDLGSGLGQVAILVNLLTGIKVRGIEFESAFCDYAGSCASALALVNVEFVNTDARDANYSEGTVVFMYTPFSGEMLQEVLEVLRKESLSRKIKIITYGPCTAEIATQSWLDLAGPKNPHLYQLAVFTSI